MIPNKNIANKIIAACIINDAIIIYYLLSRYYFGLEEIIASYAEQIKSTFAQSPSLQIDQQVFETAFSQASVVVKWLILGMVVFLIIYHALVYFSFFRNKQWALGYLKILSWSGVVLGGLFLVLNLISGEFITYIYVLPLPFLYGYVIKVLKTNL